MADYPASYYAATAQPAPERPPLAGRARRRGLRRRRRLHRPLGRRSSSPSAATRSWCSRPPAVGWGASGRNGGQIVNGLNAGLETIAAPLRRGDGGLRRHAWCRRAAGSSASGWRSYGIDCDLKDGQPLHRLHPEADARARGQAGALAPPRPRQLRDARPRRHPPARRQRRLRRRHARPQRRPPAPAEPGARPGGGAGGPRRHHPRGDPGRAGRGRRRPAGGAHRRGRGAAAGADPRRQRLSRRRWCRRSTNRVMPFSTQIIATEPLGERGRALLPTDVCVEDVRYVLDYYRLSRRRAAALRRRHGLRRHRPGGHPRQAGAEPRADLPAARGRRGSTTPGRATARSPSAACRSSAGSGREPTSPRATAATGWSAATSSAASSPRRCTATARASTSSRVSLDPLSRAAGALPCPIPFSARGGMACATASACDDSRKKDHDRMKLRLLAAVLAGAGGPVRRSPQENVLHVYNWSDYIAEDTVAKFEAETGIKVVYDVYDFERDAGGEAARRQLRLRHRGADLELPAAADRGRTSTCRSTSRSCRT